MEDDSSHSGYHRDLTASKDCERQENQGDRENKYEPTDDRQVDPSTSRPNN